jgi:alpha-N-arabinofuranosidase
MGVRQKESDFEYAAKMVVDAREENVESGICLFQKDDNYLSFTLRKTNDQFLIQIKSAEAGKSPSILTSKNIDVFTGEIVLRVISRGSSYSFAYSCDNGRTFINFGETPSNLILSRGYTGAYLGVYASSNGKQTDAFTDFDWVQYKGFQRLINQQ